MQKVEQTWASYLWADTISPETGSIDCVLELTAVVETQIANQHEVTKGKEQREEFESQGLLWTFSFPLRK